MAYHIFERSFEHRDANLEGSGLWGFIQDLCEGNCLYVRRLGGVFFGGLRGTWQGFECWVSVY